jgi:hypothetical protein
MDEAQAEIGDSVHVEEKYAAGSHVSVRIRQR